MKFPEARELWEQKIERIQKSIRAGAHMPPLIATNFWTPTYLTISDGAHRHEALRREGYSNYWVILWFGSADDKDRLK